MGRKEVCERKGEWEWTINTRCKGAEMTTWVSFFFFSEQAAQQEMFISLRSQCCKDNIARRVEGICIDTHQERRGWSTCFNLHSVTAPVEEQKKKRKMTYTSWRDGCEKILLSTIALPTSLHCTLKFRVCCVRDSSSVSALGK